MPVSIRKLKGKGYSVRTPGGVKSKNTSKKNALAQERLLNAVEHSDWRPTDMRAHMKKRVMMKP
jgi:hypothetical protein